MQFGEVTTHSAGSGGAPAAADSKSSHSGRSAQPGDGVSVVVSVVSPVVVRSGGDGEWVVSAPVVGGGGAVSAVVVGSPEVSSPAALQAASRRRSVWRRMVSS
jgi:hypothetical protein